MLRSRYVAVFAALLLVAVSARASQLIVNARLADGTGAPLSRQAVRIDGERIVSIGALKPLVGEEVIDARGHVLAPGFIDTHSHDDLQLAAHRDAEAALSQGITTIVVGQDGDSTFPLAKYFEHLENEPASVNVASYVGHGSLRSKVLGKDFRRLATRAEIEEMKGLLAQELSAGALGLSSGLEYEPGSFADTGELIELAHEAARHGGRYISHIRSEDVRLDEAIDELLKIGREACVPVQISHFKIGMRSRWGDAGKLLRSLDAARKTGIDVTADVYPYEYWQSTLRVLFADRNYDDHAAAEFALKNLAAPEDLRLSSFKVQPGLVGRTVAEIARQRHTDPATALIALIRESQSFSNNDLDEMVIGKSMSGDDVRRLIAWDHANISSDGQLVDAHPRGAGTFTRVLRVYVRESKTLTLEVALRKMTAESAAHVGISDRGVLREGAYADLVMFDPATVTDRATVEHPHLLSSGILRVWVNGRTVWVNGRATQTYAGKVVRRSSTPASFQCGRFGDSSPTSAPR